MARFARQGIEDPMVTLSQMALQTQYADLSAGFAGPELPA